MKAIALALATVLVLPGCSASADVPTGPQEPVRVAMALPERPAGPVLDEADLLPAETEAALNKRLSDYWTKTRTAVVVTSVNSLGGNPIERYSLELAQTWGIGDPENQRSLLVLVAPNERRVRIEVSCGLENVITDVFAGRVIRERMIPEFKEGALDKGTLAAVDALIGRLDASANPAPDECGSHTKEAA